MKDWEEVIRNAADKGQLRMGNTCSGDAQIAKLRAVAADRDLKLKFANLFLKGAPYGLSCNHYGIDGESLLRTPFQHVIQSTSVADARREAITSVCLEYHTGHPLFRYSPAIEGRES